jgi:hypothetical protein
MEVLHSVLLGRDPDAALKDWPVTIVSTSDITTSLRNAIHTSDWETLKSLISSDDFSVDLYRELVQNLITSHQTVISTQQLLDLLIRKKGFQLRASEIAYILDYVFSFEAYEHSRESKRFKNAAKKLKLSLSMTEASRCYMISSLISKTTAIPDLLSENILQYLLLLLKLSFTEAKMVPKPDSVLSWITHYIDTHSNKGSESISELQELVQKHMKQREVLESIEDLLSVEPELLPQPSLPKYVRTTLEKII